MKTMCKFTAPGSGYVFALKAFDIHRIDAHAGYCTITIQGVADDGEWKQEPYDVVGTIDQIIAEVER